MKYADLKVGTPTLPKFSNQPLIPLPGQPAPGLRTGELIDNRR